MDLQAWFYVLAILFLVGWLVFLGVMIGVVLVLFKRTRNIQDVISEKLQHPGVGLATVLLPVLAMALPLIKQWRSARKD